VAGGLGTAELAVGKGRCVALHGRVQCHFQKGAGADDPVWPSVPRIWLGQKWWSHCLAAVAVAFVSGCAVGPDFAPPASPDVNGYTSKPLPRQTAASDDAAGAAQHFAIGRDIPGDWWRVFGSRPLSDLVQRALTNNPDLAAAQAALRVAQANTAAAQGAFYPSIDGGLGASRQKNGVGSPVGIQTESSTYSLFTGQVQVSYTPDVFGATRRTVESLQAQAANERFQLEATYLALTANIVLAVIQEASLRGQIAVTHKLIRIATELLNTLREQQSAGAVSDAEILAQEAALAQIEQTLPLLERQLAQQRHLLSALTGGLPSQEPPEKFELNALQLPRNVPVSLPSQLVEQRPDVRAAEANMQTASALIGVAVANRLPNISLTGSVGVNALSLDQLFTPAASVWSIGGAALAPIFHGGTLFEREVAARETFDQASSQYRSVVINAFKNVADCLTALQTDAVALQKAVASEIAAAKSLEITRRRLRIGEINYFELLNAQQTYQRALITLVAVRSSRFADTAALFQALGGGWWNRADVEPRKQISFVGAFLDPLH
jgi:NodT family efflux transporter outer membrane factor (OMF) lipoprotein